MINLPNLNKLNLRSYNQHTPANTFERMNVAFGNETNLILKRTVLVIFSRELQVK